MKPEDILSDSFLQQFKSGTELTTFLEDLHKRGVEKILEGELDAHLDYEKHQKRSDTNTRNGYTSKKLKTTLGETTIQVPRDRDSSFNPMLIKKTSKYSRRIREYNHLTLCKRHEYQ